MFGIYSKNVIHSGGLFLTFFCVFDHHTTGRSFSEKKSVLEWYIK
jgi:hypothetical protein